jgi:hypothetical protein
MLVARNKMLEAKYEINTGLLTVRARSLESVSGTPPFAQLILDSFGPEVEDLDDAPVTRTPSLFSLVALKLVRL